MMRSRPYRLAGSILGVLLLTTALFATHSCWLPGPRADECQGGRLVCEPGWRCTRQGDACRQDGCGDGIVDPAAGEVCDDGNHIPGDGCSADCASKEECGNGITDPGEACDDGNRSNNDSCLDGVGEQCKDATCGDGFVNVGFEECDDGNDDDTDACLNDCQQARCGDMNVWVGNEQCDDGNISEDGACVPGCRRAFCGDGFIRAEGEDCDDGNADTTDACVNCREAECGDGHVQLGVEECDDGNQNDRDACGNDCKIKKLCGNGVLDPGEQCDDGNQNDEDDCPDGDRGTCQFAFCGDGFPWRQENGQESCDCPGGDACATCNGNPCKDDCTMCLSGLSTQVTN